MMIFSLATCSQNRKCIQNRIMKDIGTYHRLHPQEETNGPLDQKIVDDAKAYCNT